MRKVHFPWYIIFINIIIIIVFQIFLFKKKHFEIYFRLNSFDYITNFELKNKIEWESGRMFRLVM
jgi:hypothetical protein